MVAVNLNLALYFDKHDWLMVQSTGLFKFMGGDIYDVRSVLLFLFYERGNR